MRTMRISDTRKVTISIKLQKTLCNKGVTSTHFDGKQPQWYHFLCFFQKKLPNSSDDIDKFECLRIEDQNRIKEALDGSLLIPVKRGRGKKRSAGSTTLMKGAPENFRIEYSKSDKALCKKCQQKIPKDQIRVSKILFAKTRGKAGQDAWHHLSCFAALLSEFGYSESAERLPGFDSLLKNDQQKVRMELANGQAEDVPETKKAKTKNVIEGLTEEESELYIEQNKIFFTYRDELKRNLNKNQLIQLLQYNNQRVPPGQESILDCLADYMTFGALLRCSICNGRFVFEKFGYKCIGNITEWTKCKADVKYPPRVPFRIPPHISDKFPNFQNYKFVKRTRVIKPVPDNSTERPPANKTPTGVFYLLKFVILGNPKRGKDLLRKQILELGGQVRTRIGHDVVAVISSPEEVEKMSPKMALVKKFLLHVVPEEFVDEVPKDYRKIPQLIEDKSICDWGSNTYINCLFQRIARASKPCTSVTVNLKNGTAVDPDSGLQFDTHVYIHDSKEYSEVLSKTDIQTKQNTFYKLQLLESEVENQYFVYRSWGRIGTKVGGNKLDSFDCLDDAKSLFCQIFEDKTRNKWENRDNFRKVPNMFNLVNVDYGRKELPKLSEDTKSELPEPVQNLVKFIFDAEAMKDVMRHFKLDLDKMPLGKLSKKQIQNAYSVLNELQNLIESNGSEARLIDASNRFYSFIPHSFGMSDLPILRETIVIKEKVEMLDNLMEIEVGYNLMHRLTGSKHTVDDYYNLLHTEIEVLDKESEEHKIIEKYLTNTHSSVHGFYKLDLINVFTIKREGEARRFEPFKNLHNHKLLWHGSRATNFAGILAEGLRIAPPEAPKTGYMFGKGIYFADMVSKSANYCCSTYSNCTGLLLLCDVALGDMYERTQPTFIEVLPEGKHSTKGVGRIQPNPEACIVYDGFEVPLGEGVPYENATTVLYHNEYIVYNVSQVNIRYLLQVHFNMDYGK